MQTNFKTKVDVLNYDSKEESASSINRFIGQATNHTIKDALSADSIDSTTELLIINAIYFKLSWKTQFPIGFTNQGRFYLSATEEVTVDMMNIGSRGYNYFPFAEIDELNAEILAICLMKMNGFTC